MFQIIPGESDFNWEKNIHWQSLTWLLLVMILHDEWWAYLTCVIIIECFLALKTWVASTISSRHSGPPGAGWMDDSSTIFSISSSKGPSRAAEQVNLATCLRAVRRGTWRDDDVGFTFDVYVVKGEKGRRVTREMLVLWKFDEISLLSYRGDYADGSCSVASVNHLEEFDIVCVRCAAKQDMDLCEDGFGLRRWQCWRVVLGLGAKDAGCTPFILYSTNMQCTNDWKESSIKMLLHWHEFGWRVYKSYDSNYSIIYNDILWYNICIDL